VFFTANHLTDTDKQNTYRKVHKLNTTQNANNTKTQQNKTILVQSPLMTLGQETGWAYYTMLPSPHKAQISKTSIYIVHHHKTSLCAG